MPEVSTGLPSPPRSPPLAAAATENEARSQQAWNGMQARNGASSVGGGIAYHITEECERLFCERLRSTFLGERKATTTQDSLVMGVQQQQQQQDDRNKAHGRQMMMDHLETRKMAAGSGMAEICAPKNCKITKYLEMFDYRGDMGIRGFVSQDQRGTSTMFVFFGSDVAGKDLKTGLMAVLELADEKAFECSEMVVCLDRAMPDQDMASTTRDLGWVGFEMTTLEPWSRQIDDTSKNWIFLAMEI